jgi:LacI family transcriptional regulator
MTIEEIAAIAEVSRSTVSRVLNNHPSVRPGVRERVLQVIEQHNYTPHPAARSLAGRSTGVICLVIPRQAGQIFADAFFALVIQGISEACTARGIFLMLSMITADAEPSFYSRFLRGRHFDGVIMLSSDVDDPILPRLVRDTTPLVLVGHHPFLPGITSVDVENREGARQAVAYLLNLGHRRIATITGLIQMQASIDRRDGYKQALLEAGVPIVPELIVAGDFTQEGGHRAMRRLLQAAPLPTGVFVASDTMALGALRAVREAGLSVPRDISLVGYDDLPGSAFAEPPLTTMRQPIAELGAAAVRLLVEQIERGTPSTARADLSATLVVRESAAPPPTS